MMLVITDAVAYRMVAVGIRNGAENLLMSTVLRQPHRIRTQLQVPTVVQITRHRTRGYQRLEAHKPQRDVMQEGGSTTHRVNLLTPSRMDRLCPLAPAGSWETQNAAWLLGG